MLQKAMLVKVINPTAVIISLCVFPVQGPVGYIIWFWKYVSTMVAHGAHCIHSVLLSLI